MHNIAERGRQASVDGFAHEHIAAGILMKRYENVSFNKIQDLKENYHILENCKIGK